MKESKIWFIKSLIFMVSFILIYLFVQCCISKPVTLFEIGFVNVVIYSALYQTIDEFVRFCLKEYL